VIAGGSRTAASYRRAAGYRAPEARDGLAVMASAMLAGITEAGIELARTLGR
jgi:hypothetical protein